MARFFSLAYAGPHPTIQSSLPTLAIERHALTVSHDRYRTRDIGGDYTALGRAIGGYAERVERPEEIAGAFQRARKVTEEGQAALLECITSEEIAFSHRRAF